MSDTRDTAEGHVCMGCRKQIGDGEPHIHVGLDEFSAREGLTQFGLDDLLTFAFCEPCTSETDDGWFLEAHVIPETELP